MLENMGDSNKRETAASSTSPSFASDASGTILSPTSMHDGGGATPTSVISASNPIKRLPALSTLSNPTSATASPRVSREASPVRLHSAVRLPPAGGAAATGRRSSVQSRKGSQELSPARSAIIPTVPSAAAIQRALSAAGVAGNSNNQVDSNADPQRNRLPQISRNPRIATTTAPRSARKDTSPTVTKRTLRLSDGEEERSGNRTPGRSCTSTGATSTPLETVQESSVASAPLNFKIPTDGHIDERLSGNESSSSLSACRDMTDSAMSLKPLTSRPSILPAIQNKKSFTQLSKHTAKPAEGSVKNMTVETETVSVPQVAVPGTKDLGGSLRAKPSYDTIRPKREKKRGLRKAQSLTVGPPSSKADIFEAKVASAVDEADSSDSEETFVYESNPPEPAPSRPINRFHSRTPSTTSIFSHKDQRKEASIVGKKSMKFATNYNAHGSEADSTVRGPSSRNGTSNQTHHHHHHHHIGRYGRSHPSIVDHSPFPPAKNSSNSAASHLQQFSPRQNRTVNRGASPRKSDYAIDYDLEGNGADDEETPLITRGYGTANRRRRALPGSLRQPYGSDSRRMGAQGVSNSCSGRLMFVSLTGLMSFILLAILVLLIMCSKALTNVHVKSIKHVLASESEMMFDLGIEAINPNFIAVQISTLDINIFAKSRHVGTSSHWRPLGVASHRWDHQYQQNETDHLAARGGVDKGTDPPPPSEDPSQTMLLGRIFSFDSPVAFAPSPFAHRPSVVMGQLRLSKPGNATEQGGSVRWEHVLQHEFELIVRGVMKYAVPMIGHGTGGLKSAPVFGKALVKASGNDDDSED